MKRLFTCGLTAIALLAFALAAGAHEPPGELFLAVQFPDTHVPNIDGFDDDWSAVPLEVYAIPSSMLFSVHGFAGDDVPRGGMDPASMQIRHILGWNDSRNELYVTTRIFDNKHTITRQDLGSYWWDDSIEIEFKPASRLLAQARRRGDAPQVFVRVPAAQRQFRPGPANGCGQ